MKLLNDDIIFLRALEPEDLDILHLWENDTDLWTIGNSIAPFSRKQLWDYIENYNSDIYSSRQLRLMITMTSSGEAIGTIDFYDFDPFNHRSGIGILIDKKHQHKGYGRRSLKLASDYAGNFLGLHQFYAIIPCDNTNSLSLFNKCGYKTTGQLTDWLRIGNTFRDAVIMQLQLK